MLFRRGWWLALAWACSGKDPDPGVSPEPPEPFVPPETTSPPLSASRPDFPCFADVAYDEGRDGAIEGVGFQGYDEAVPTRILYEDGDDNGNGLFDYIATYEYDAAGNRTRLVRQRSGAYILTTDWDDSGNPLSFLVDLGGDGVVDYSYAYSWENDLLVLYQYDADGDGDFETTLEYEYNPEGLRQVGIEDTDGDGEYDTRYTYTYDEMGRETVRTRDDGIDDVIDSTRTFTYTDEVLLIGGSELDEGMDLVIDEVTEFEHDVDGNELYYAMDDTPDGEWTDTRSGTYDAEGRELTLEYYYYDDGDPYTYLYTYSYDELGRTVQETTHLSYETGEVYIDEQYDYTFAGTCP